ncbi:hypothetical protein J6590_070179 [Homalodisca vitripennis]|nr:hypothetical protein J6590_070179 [Homalodisca vitripennis]
MSVRTYAAHDTGARGRSVNARARLTGERRTNPYHRPDAAKTTDLCRTDPSDSCGDGMLTARGSHAMSEIER